MERRLRRRQGPRRLACAAMVLAALALAGCAGSVPLPPPVVAPGPNGWLHVTQAPYFTVDMPGRPAVSVQHHGFMNRVEAHVLSVESGRVAFIVMYVVPAAGWNTSNLAKIRNDMLHSLESSRGVHFESVHWSNDEVARGSLLIDRHNEFGTLPFPGRMRFVLAVVPTFSVMLLTLGPRDETPAEKARERYFLATLADASHRHPHGH